MPSAKFQNPKNGDTVPANQAFTISMAIKNLETGNFVNAQENYFAAPQQLNGQGQIVGHSHVVVEQLDALDQTTPTDPTKFAFFKVTIDPFPESHNTRLILFKGLNAAAQGGVLTADVTNGLPAAAYRLCSINTAANHQPAIVPVAQHGALDDCIYVSVNNTFSKILYLILDPLSLPRLMAAMLLMRTTTRTLATRLVQATRVRYRELPPTTNLSRPRPARGSRVEGADAAALTLRKMTSRCQLYLILLPAVRLKCSSPSYPASLHRSFCTSPHSCKFHGQELC